MENERVESAAAPTEAGPQQPRSGLSYSAADALTAIAVTLIGVIMMADNHRIGSNWAEDGPQTGYFPFHIGAILCIAGAAVFVKALFSRHRNRTAFVSWPRFKLVLAVLLPTALFVLAMQLLGIYVAATVFIGTFMRLLGKTSWLKTVAVSVGVSAVLFWMFEVQFMVPLPKGPLGSLIGY